MCVPVREPDVSTHCVSGWVVALYRGVTNEPTC